MSRSLTECAAALHCLIHCSSLSSRAPAPASLCVCHSFVLLPLGASPTPLCTSAPHSLTTALAPDPLSKYTYLNCVLFFSCSVLILQACKVIMSASEPSDLGQSGVNSSQFLLCTSVKYIERLVYP